MIVTLVAKRVRNSASSIAESPPPITVISLPEKKKPSQVAHDDTPCPISACSLGSPSHRAEAPLDMMSVRVSSLSRPTSTSIGCFPISSFFWLMSTLLTWPLQNSAPKRAACLRMFSMSSGP